MCNFRCVYLASIFNIIFWNISDLYPIFLQLDLIMKAYIILSNGHNVKEF